MNSTESKILVVILCVLFLVACGNGSTGTGEGPFSVRGTVDVQKVAEEIDGPIIVALINTDDLTKIQDDPEGVILDTVVVDEQDCRFSIDLAGKGLAAGDEVALIAFVDNNYEGGVPYPDAGDFVGVYADEENLSVFYTLRDGVNGGISIEVTREVFDFDATVEGSVRGSDAGEVTLILYAGDITSSDFSKLDFDGVIGYRKVTKGSNDLSYCIDVLSYGYDVPVENVYVLALLDVNGNGEIDGGDRVGYYSEDEDDFPTLITVDEGTVSGIDIAFHIDVPEASGYEILVQGTVTLPGGAGNDDPLKPVYVIVAETDDPDDLRDDPLSAIRYFTRLAPGTTAFDIDLSDTELVPGDEVVLLALWEQDYDGGFPDPTAGDFVGFYRPGEDSVSIGYPLRDGVNGGISIEVTREVFDFDAAVAGSIRGSDAGEVTLILYAGEVTSSDFGELDFDGVIGYRKVTKGSDDLPYCIDVLPYGYDLPVENVYVLALLDVNGNGEIDGGDRVGYHSEDEDDFPTLIPVDEGTVSEIDIAFYMDVPEATGLDISLKGSFVPPAGYDETSAPVALIVTTADDPDTLFDDPISAIKYFERLPAGEFLFDIDLSKTDLLPGDEVIVIALWDRDFTAGFPKPTGGDRLGYVQNKDIYAFTVELGYGVNAVPAEGYEFKLSKKVYDFESSVRYALDMSEAGSFDVDKAQIIVMLLHVNGLEITIAPPNKVDVKVDMDYILALTTLPATEYDYIGVGERQDPENPRILDVFTQLHEEIVVWEENEPPLPLIKGEHHGEETERTAYLVAILDKDGNNELDTDDEIGYYCTGGTEVVSGSTIEIPGYGEIVLPDWLPAELLGTYYFPSPIPRITKGENRELRDDDTLGPYWIEMNHYFDATTE